MSLRRADHYVFSIEIAGPRRLLVSDCAAIFAWASPATATKVFSRSGKKALDAGVAKLIPGAKLGDVARAISSEASSAGFSTGVWSGHGMGMDLGDGIGIFEDSVLEVKEGMVITIHPHIVTGDGKEGLLLGDTFVVDQDGARNLSRTKCELKCL